MFEKMTRLFFISFLFLISCSGKPEVEIPNDIIAQDSMVKILIDIHILEAASQMITEVDAQRDFKQEEFYEFIYKKHHTTKEAFDKSYLYYSAQSELLEEIYSNVMNELSKKQGELGVKAKKVE